MIVLSALLGVSIISISLNAYSESIEEVCNKPGKNSSLNACGLLTKRHLQQNNPAKFSIITALHVKKLIGFSTRTTIV